MVNLGHTVVNWKLEQDDDVALPIVDTFNPPYEAWTTRTPTQAEMMEIRTQTGRFCTHINDQLIARVTNPLEAAHFIAARGADGGLGNHINNALDRDAGYTQWRRSMPSATPPGLKDYKSRYPFYDPAQVQDEINAHGVVLPVGQELFHAGGWPGGASLVTDRPLSTSFCPQVALRNADHKGKAYDEGRIDLFVVRVAASSTKAFVYKRRGLSLGHENEVVFAAGATLKLISETLIRDDYSAGKVGEHARLVTKNVPVYVLEIDLI